ncbi:diguanylate cyclase domain-containing protein [Thiomicrorhabdus indica]|uniref:diguanylate cyclase domain-containing protein n=1 Tax=Thiomicrorhabdus indica TaxID=2267253 RepID=UPI0013EEB512|nr:diguanylate cyclase [Thiomicrorhabdus indica]
MFKSSLRILILSLLAFNNTALASDNLQSLPVDWSKIDLPALLIEPDSGVILDANSAAKRFYGYPELTSKTIQEINTFTSKQVAEERQKALEEGRNYFIFRHKLASGEIKKVEVFVSSIRYQGRKRLLSLIVPIDKLELSEGASQHYQTILEKSLDEQAQAIYQNRQIKFWLMGVALSILAFLTLYLYRTLLKTKHLQKHLVQTQSQLKATLNALPDLLFELDEQGVFLDFHASNRDQLYLPPKSFLGKHIKECLPPKIAELTQQNIDSMRQTGQIKHKQYQIEINGNTEYFELSASIKQNPAGENTFIFVSRNNTDRIRAEAKLARNEQNLRFISENISEVLWLRDFESGKIEYVSSVYETLWGQSRESLYEDNSRFLDSIHEEDRQGVIDSYKNLSINNSLENIYRILSSDNQVHWINARMRVIANPTTGKLLEVGRATDITDLKHKESELELAASVFQSAREAIVITLPDSTIIEVNHAFTEITGYSREEALGQKTNFLKSNKHSKGFYKNLWKSLLQNGYWTGEIWNIKKSGDYYPQLTTISTVFDENDPSQPLHFVVLFSDISEQKQHQQQLENLANFDDLTGLPNRRLLSDHLHRAIIGSERSNDLIAIAFIDLDGFKAFNDQFGHDRGDDLLIQISAKMSNILRKTDTLSRIGGDEFVVIFEEIADKLELIPLLERLLASIREINIEFVHKVQISASIGVTLYPDDKVDAEQLIRHADQAMYQAKRQGKDQYAFFDIEKELAIQSNQDWLNAIKSALGNNEFVLHYQPQVNMKTGAIQGVEALIRWQHPQEGLRYPNDFLPILSGWPIEIDIDFWVIRQVHIPADLNGDSGFI